MPEVVIGDASAPLCTRERALISRHPFEPAQRPLHVADISWSGQFP
jgi:hypothetical protein